jgi:hypothetical protein
MKYEVHWSDSNTGVKGHGEAMNKALAEQWAKVGNKEWPSIFHFTKPVRQLELVK